MNKSHVYKEVYFPIYAWPVFLYKVFIHFATAQIYSIENHNILKLWITYGNINI